MQLFRAQARLKCMLEGALQEIERQCGLVGFIILGGPELRCGGDLMVMSCVLSSLVLPQQFSLSLGFTLV